MSDIQKLINSDKNNHKIFAGTILTLMMSQGFYERLYDGINEFNEEQYNLLYQTLNNQKFKDSVDVILWLES